MPEWLQKALVDALATVLRELLAPHIPPPAAAPPVEP
jgi:hypothetical protein